MSQNRGRVDLGGNAFIPAGPGMVQMDQRQIYSVTTVGSAVLPAVALLTGILNRSGPVAAYGDTLPNAADIIAASPMCSTGDSFSLIWRNTVAFANTLAAGVGIVLGSNVNQAVSEVREYLFTVLGGGIGGVAPVTTTNASAVITGLTAAQIAAFQIQVGMGVTGTGIPASTSVIGVDPNTGSVTLSANATASGLASATFFPRIRVDGVRGGTL